MKKIIACLFAVSVLSTAAFSKNFFSQRFVEVKVGTKADFSNNLFALNDFMQKDLVIDLRKIADECPKNGFNMRADAAPSLALNVNIGSIHVGLSSGLEVYNSMTVGKDLFDFLGYGNSVGETLDFSFKDDADIMAVSQLDVGFKLGRLKIKAQPAVFLPLISVRDGGGRATVLNSSDGSLDINVDMNMNVYSCVELKSDDGQVSMDPSAIKSAVVRGYGFDIGGGVAYSLSPSFFVEATTRIPIIPGHLYHKATIESGTEYKMQLKDFGNSEKTEREMTVTNEEANLIVHRPLKLNVYADKNLLGTLFNARGGAGFGIRRPFSEDAKFYPEYYLGLTFNLADILKLCASTEYTDQLFIHQLGTTVNVRVFQLDLGISTQSSNFKKSLAVAGVGGYAYVSMGF